MLSKIIPILVATLLAAGAGGGFGFILIDLIKQDPAAEAEKSEAGDKPAKASDELLVSLPTILTNLASPKDAWVRMEAQIVTSPTGASELLAAQISEDIVAYMRTVHLSSLEGAAGFRALRADLKDRARIRSRGEVKDIILREFVIE
ncbi:MAG: flagellar basal body-associated FliL family protein [Hyphomicrobiales bacterium]|nr:flagellar basal body-associated FliL family protein [Hyphomicrobiales bacterium]